MRDDLEKEKKLKRLKEAAESAKIGAKYSLNENGKEKLTQGIKKAAGEITSEKVGTGYGRRIDKEKAKNVVKTVANTALSTAKNEATSDKVGTGRLSKKAEDLYNKLRKKK